MFWRRRGNTRGGCIIIPIPCGCITSPVVVLSGAASCASPIRASIASSSPRWREDRYPQGNVVEAGHQSLFHTSPSRGWITVALALVRFDPCRLHPLNRDAGEAAKRQLSGS